MFPQLAELFPPLMAVPAQLRLHAFQAILTLLTCLPGNLLDGN